jgi:hypothetical protein
LPHAFEFPTPGQLFRELPGSIIRGFLDETISSPIAGYVATADEWARLRDAWSSVLRE